MITTRKKNGYRYFYVGKEYIAFYTIREERADIRLSKLHFDTDWDGIIVTKKDFFEHDVKGFLEENIPLKELAIKVFECLKKDFGLRK